METTLTLPAPAATWNHSGSCAGSRRARIGRRIIVGVLCLLLGQGLAGCTSSPQQLGDVDASHRRFTHCHGYGCASVSRLGFSDSEWQDIRTLMQPPATRPADERRLIRVAIAHLEQLVGAKTGTGSDRGGTFRAAGRPGQLDCIDESTNTRVYLHMLYDDHLLTWHQPFGLAHRGLLIVGGWPHTTAVIREQGSDKRFAVDSWFLDNGKLPHIVELTNWQQGWRP